MMILKKTTNAICRKYSKCILALALHVIVLMHWRWTERSKIPVIWGCKIFFTFMSSSLVYMALCIQALKVANFSSAQPTQQTIPGTSVATGPALPQHLAAHPYSQPTLPVGPFANMIGYPFLPQSYAYMPSGFQQAFAGNTTYHQSLAAAMLPQYKNSVSVSSLPQSAAVPSGYGGFGSTTTIPGNFPMNPPAAPSGTNLGYDDVLSAQYKENSHLMSLQQQQQQQQQVWYLFHHESY